MDEILIKLDKGWQCGAIELNPKECKVLLQYIQKVQMSSLYGEHKEIYKNVKISIDTSNGYFKDENVDVEITDKFIIIRNKETEKFYNIKETEYFSITKSESEEE